jgi:RNA polymerase sigma-70 factor (ECF subfamily)
VYRRHAQEVALLLRHGFAFEASGLQHRFVGFGSGFELQDVLHETFRRAFEPSARTAYDGIRPYGAYVCTIARNLVLRSYRAREVLFPLVDGEQPSRAASIVAIDEGPSPERSVYDAEVRELVAAFLATLAPDERRLIELRFIEGLSQRDAAVALGLGRQRVRTHEQRLRAKLLAYLRERGEAALVDGVVAALPTLLGLDLLGWDLLEWLGEVTR